MPVKAEIVIEIVSIISWFIAIIIIIVIIADMDVSVMHKEGGYLNDNKLACASYTGINYEQNENEFLNWNLSEVIQRIQLDVYNFWCKFLHITILNWT